MPKSEEKTGLEKFFRSVAGLLTAGVAVVTALGSVWALTSSSIENYVKSALPNIVKSEKSIDIHFRDIAKSAFSDMMTSEDGIKVLGSALRKVGAGPGKLQATTDLAFGFSIYFTGNEIIRQRRPMNRVYFYAAPDHKVSVNVYFSGNRKFPVNVKVNGKPAWSNVQDTRDLDVTRWLLPTALANVDSRYAPPTDDLDRPQDVHFIEFNTVDRYQFTNEDLHEISGVIMVKKRSL